MGLRDTKDSNRFKPHLAEIEDTPVSPLGRKILWAIVLFMLIASLWLYFGKTDVVVSGRAEVIPVGNVKTLQSLDSGVIKQIFVKEGDSIKKGAALIEIDPTVAKTNIEAKKRNIELLSLEVKKLQALIDGREFIPPADVDSDVRVMISGMYKAQQGSIDSQKLQIDAQIREIEDQIRGLEVDINRAKSLLEIGLQEERRMRSVLDLIAKNNYYQKQKENIGYKNDIQRKEREIAALKDKLHELQVQKNSLDKNFKARLYEDLSRKTRELTNLKSEVQAIEFKKRKQVITSPVDGIVAKIAVNTVGGVVTPAQKLITVVPKDAPMQLKAIIENKDIGFVKKGMEAVIKIDTFDYQKYGLLHGKVEKISANAIEDEKLGLVYEVYIKPEKNYIEADGEKHYLIPGMSARVELKVGERRIIEFFIYPLIKYYKEGISVR